MSTSNLRCLGGELAIPVYEVRLEVILMAVGPIIPAYHSRAKLPFLACFYYTVIPLFTQPRPENIFNW
jgi:hypothetical protein